MQKFSLLSGCSCAGMIWGPLMLQVVKWLRWSGAAGSPVEGRLAGKAGGELAPCQAHAGIWRDLSSPKPWNGAGLLSGAWRPGGENPKGVPRAGSPPMLCSSLDPTAPGTASHPHLAETLPISPSFSQKLSPMCQTQHLESFTLSCLRHHLHVGTDGHGSALVCPSAHKMPGKN